MKFYSILFKKENKQNILDKDLDIFKDLNLKDVFDTIVSEKKEYDIERFFYLPLSDLNTILYRQDIVKDLIKDDFYKQVELFSKNLKDLKKQRDFISKMEYTALKKVLFYKMMHRYTKTILTLLEDIKSVQINSEGFTLLEHYITKHTKNNDFQKMQKELLSLNNMINSLEFDITLDALTIKVKRYESEEDYTNIVKKVFGKFSKNSSKDIVCHYEKNRGINHINAKIYEFVAKLNPKLFLKLENFYNDYMDFMDKTIISFSNEVQFYIAFIKYINSLKNPSLSFSFPTFNNKKEIHITDGFDMALLSGQKNIVTNDYHFSKQERIMILTGVNSGGKTTYARAFGQINYIAKLGLSIAAKEADLHLCDKIFTHFEKEEHIANLHSKLQDDVYRVHNTLLQSSPDSIIILNEIFASTSFQDALYLSKKILHIIDKLDLFCIWVTFIKELNTLSNKTKSMTTLYKDGLITHKILPSTPTEKTNAEYLCDKYHLNYDQILKRIR